MSFRPMRCRKATGTVIWTSRERPRPIILLQVPQKCVAPWGAPLKRPYHLLEGQTRLAVFTVLRDRGELLDHHPVWVVKKENWLGTKARSAA